MHACLADVSPVACTGTRQVLESHQLDNSTLISSDLSLSIAHSSSSSSSSSSCNPSAPAAAAALSSPLRRVARAHLVVGGGAERAAAGRAAGQRVALTPRRSLRQGRHRERHRRIRTRTRARTRARREARAEPCRAGGAQAGGTRARAGAGRRRALGAVRHLLLQRADALQRVQVRAELRRQVRVHEARHLRPTTRRINVITDELSSS